MSRVKRVQPVTVAQHYVKMGIDQDGLEKRFINDEIGKIIYCDE